MECMRWKKKSRMKDFFLGKTTNVIKLYDEKERKWLRIISSVSLEFKGYSYVMIDYDQP